MTTEQPAGAASGAGPSGSPRSRALHVAAGIFASRIAGLLRDRAIAHVFGVGAHADVFRTVLRGPNVLQNLLGEGSISASFVPVYSRLIHEGRTEEAGRLAGAVFGLLLALVSALTLAGILLARPLVAVLVPGFLGDAAAVAAGELDINRFELAVRAVRIIFPMTGVLVLAAWALGVLNAHRRFLLPYLGPVLWNVAIIATLAVAGASLWGPSPPTAEIRTRLLFAACWGALAGGVAQFAVQLPLVARLVRGFRLSFSARVRGVREVLAAFGPAVAGRGVYQISAYLDLILGSLLAAGALAALGYAQMLYVLPVSLFGLSVAASELPELSRQTRPEAAEAFNARIRRSLRQIAFMTVPTAVGYLAFGYLLVGALWRTGRFSVADNRLVYLVLAAYATGIVATTWSRLLQNAYFALGDTRTPAKIAGVRLAVSAVCAVPLMFWLDRFEVTGVAAAGSNDTLRAGAAGLALASGIAAWTELATLTRTLSRKAPGFRPPGAAALKMFALAVLSIAPAAAAWWALPPTHVILEAFVVVGVFALVYLAGARLAGISELAAWLSGMRR
jgi:putative peptidoglycan lipid II flippase